MEFDPWEILCTRLKDVVLPMVVVVAVSAVAASLPFLHRIRDKTAFLGTVAAFGLIGGVIGLFTGASRDPVVGAVLPAFLTLAGGFVTYILGRQEASAAPDGTPAPVFDPPDVRRLAISILIVIALTGSWMAFFGSSLRTTAETHHRETVEKPYKIFEYCLSHSKEPFCAQYFQ